MACVVMCVVDNNNKQAREGEKRIEKGLKELELDFPELRLSGGVAHHYSSITRTTL